MIRRDNYNEVERSLKKKEITILIGARQVGKTTLLRKLMQGIAQKGELAVYFNLDIENDAAYTETQNKLLNKIRL